jgi:phosphatidylglycerol---prolipoprotein diacylglyceryl transferase
VHFPVYLSLGPIAFHPHPVFEMLAYVIGARVYSIVKAHSGDSIPAAARWWVVTAAFVGAALGAKVLVWLDHPAVILAHWQQPLVVFDGKSVVGALVGGLIAVEWTKYRIGVRRSTGDVFAIPLTVGIAIGRIGCFLSGLDDNTYGLPANLPWAVDFGDGISRHPTQIYEILFLVAVLLPVLVYLTRRPHGEGDVFKIFMIGYLAFRLGLEFLKPGESLAGLNAIQWICLATLVWYARYVPDLVRRPKMALARA